MDWRRCNDPARLRQLIGLLESENKQLRGRLGTVTHQLVEATGEQQLLQRELELVAATVNDGANEDGGNDDDDPGGGGGGGAKPGRNKYRDNGGSRRRRRKDRDKPQRKKKRSRSGRTEQDALERHVTLALFAEQPDERQLCPCCRQDETPHEVRMRPRPNDFETSELVDVISVRYVVHEVRRQKAICPRCQHVRAAEAPALAVATTSPPEASLALDTTRTRHGGRYSLRFAAQVAAHKYAEQTPLERQVRQMRRAGLEVGSHTLFEQCAALAEYALPTYRALFWWLQSQAVIGTDQTRWPRLDDDERDWQLWCLSHPRAGFFCVRPSKDTQAALDLVGHFVGTLVCDAMSSHGAASRAGPTGFVEARCMSHVRARLYDLEGRHPEVATALDLIGELFAVECAHELGTVALWQARQEHSRVTLEKLRVELVRLQLGSDASCASLRKAVGYALNQWPHLIRFVDDSRIWLDNNASERLVRQPVLGRKTHYGSRTQRGADVSMVLYTLVESARLNGLDPQAYLERVARAGQQRGQLGVVLPFAHAPYTRAPEPLPWEVGGRRIVLQPELTLEANAD